MGYYPFISALLGFLLMVLIIVFNRYLQIERDSSTFVADWPVPLSFTVRFVEFFPWSVLASFGPLKKCDFIFAINDQNILPSYSSRKGFLTNSGAKRAVSIATNVRLFRSSKTLFNFLYQKQCLIK